MMVAVALLLMVLLTGCCISHDWQDATCTEPKTCAKCGETEGEALGHTWLEATCTAPKTCSVCGETEGEALEHIFAEANYQQPATCTVCGTTVAKIWATNYQVFESDDTHPAKEGYEWKTVEFHIVGGDENSAIYGYSTPDFRGDYYHFSRGEDLNYFGVSYNGIDYSECESYDDLEDLGWDERADYEEQFGWLWTWKRVYNVDALVPKGHDGFLAGIYNFRSNFLEVDDYTEVDTNDYRYFRFQ